MRADEPVWYDQAARAWNVSRYDDVARVLGDARTFSSDFGRAFPDRADLAEGNIVAMDPPRHDQLRGLVGQAFTPAAWADALLEQGSTRPDDAAVDLIRERLKKFHDYLRAHVAWRRARSSGDLLSDLVDAEIDDVHLTDAEIVGFATILLLAGHVTTTLVLGHIALPLDERPHVQALLRAQTSSNTGGDRGDPALPKPGSVDRAGDNHRGPNWRPGDSGRAHGACLAGVGRGLHYCLGASLARLEARVALEALLRRFASIRVDSAQRVEYYPRFNGPRSLHLWVKAA